jgi:hypothetical protein
VRPARCSKNLLKFAASWKPQPRGGDADLRVFAVLLAESGQGLLGEPGLAEAHQGVHHQCLCRGHRMLRRDEPLGQPLGRLEGGQRLGVLTARQLEHPAEVADTQSRRGVGFGFEGAFGALDPRLRLIQLSLPEQ